MKPLVHDIVLNLLNIAALSALGMIAHQNDILVPRVRRSFVLAVMGTIVVVVSEIMADFLESRGAPLRQAAMAFNVMGFLISPLLPALIANAFCGRVRWLRAALLLPAALNALVTLLTPVFGFLFTISPEGVYSRGPLFFVYIVSYVASLTFLLLETLCLVNTYQNKNSRALFLLYPFLLLGTSVQIVWPSMRTAWACVTLAMMMYYAYYCEIVSKYDTVTNLFNRRVYERHLQHLAQRERAVILLLDVDDFKSANDNYGHAFGDQCLSCVAASVLQAFRGLGLCYRIGGDEFCVLCKTAEEAALDAAAAAFFEDIDASRERDLRLPMVSLGRALYSKGEGAIERAVQEADRQMFLYKQQRKEERRHEPAFSG